MALALHSNVGYITKSASGLWLRGVRNGLPTKNTLIIGPRFAPILARNDDIALVQGYLQVAFCFPLDELTYSEAPQQTMRKMERARLERPGAIHNRPQTTYAWLSRN